MCTVSWLRTQGGYELFCNRDERRVRGPERAPEVRERGGIRWLAPRDADFGGTWVAVNEIGLAVTLLNGYTASRGEPRAEWTSRGLLVDALADAAGAGEVEQRVRRADLSVYQPFQLLALDAESGLEILRWDGLELEPVADPEREMPLVSSGVQAERVRAHRKSVLSGMAARRGRLTAEDLAAYHRSHEGGPSALSTCMHREDAETRSLSRIAVSESEVRFDYTPGAPCRAAGVPTLRLSRRAAAGPAAPSGPAR